jgi:hypothetical protein
VNNSTHKYIWQNGSNGALKIVEGEVEPEGEWYLIGRANPEKGDDVKYDNWHVYATDSKVNGETK